MEGVIDVAHRNEDLVRKGYDAFGKGDLETIRELFSSDIIWHVSGRGPLSGTYKGVGEVFGLFGELAQRSQGTFRVELHDVIANDDHAVALTVNRGMRDGASLRSPSVAIYHVRDGRVSEAWLAPHDAYAEDEFWS